MKHSALILLFVFAIVCARAQTVTLSVKNESLKEIFTEINRQTGFQFMYNTNMLKNAKPVSLDVKEASLEDVLESCFKNQPLTYIIDKRTIIIREKEIPAEPKAEPPKKKAETMVSGTVTDKSGVPLPGVNVLVKDTNNGTATAANGTYTVQVGESDVLVLSFIGYKNAEEKVNGRMVIDITLEEDVTTLKEVTISGGYYETTEKTRTGNIVKVEAKDVEKQPVTNPLMALQGRVPGLEITPVNGTPGSAPTIRIRGTNSLRNSDRSVDPNGNYPLYVIDGVPVNAAPVKSVSLSFMGSGFDPLSSISPENIESIEVLKDGDATAIYGSRGANGVILITTKQGNMASRTNFDISMYRGMGELSNKLELLNTKQYLEMRHEAFKNDGIVPTLVNAPDLLLWDTTRYTDWQKVLLGGAANITDLQGSISGGNGSTSFRFGGGYHKETMILPGDFWYKRGTLNLSLNHTSINKKFRANLSTNYGINRNKLFDDANFINYALFLSPNAPGLYDENGNLNWAINPSTGLNSWTNPMSFIKKGNESRSSNLIMNGVFSYELIPGLTVKTNLGFTEFHGNEISKDPLSSRAPNALGPSPVAVSSFGNNQRKSWIAEPQVTYTKNFSNHSIDALIGGSFQENTYLFQRIRATYTSDEFIESLQAASTVTYSADDESIYRYASLLARIGYNYNEKYLLNLTGRRDGSSRFGPGNKFGNFGSIGAAWIFSNESLIKDNLIFLSFGKLRASYGITGSDQIGDYKFYDLYRVGTSYNNIAGLFPEALFNPKFAWEETTKFEIAMQLGFVQDRISFEWSWYRNQSSNQLVNYPLPATTGFSSILENFDATIQNSGLEVVLNTIAISSENFKWNTSFNISFPRNKLIEFDGIEDSPYALQYKVGESLAIQRLYKWTGVDPQTGIDTFLDVNPDGIYDESDKLFMHPRDRKYLGGLINTFRYKSFEVSFLLQFADQNAKRYINVRPGVGSNHPLTVLDRWQREGDITEISKFSQVISGSGYSSFSRLLQSDAVIENASFIRLKTFSFSYLFPQKIIQHMKMQGAKFYIQGQNLFTIASLKNLDPETGSSLPPLRMLTIGMQIKF